MTEFEVFIVLAIVAGITAVIVNPWFILVAFAAMIFAWWWKDEYDDSDERH